MLSPAWEVISFILIWPDQHMRKFSIYILSLFFVWGCSGTSAQPRLHKYTEIEMLMGTTIRIDVCVENEEAAQFIDLFTTNIKFFQKEKVEILTTSIDVNTEKVSKEALKKVWQRLEDISWRMNVFDEKSDVAKINISYPNALEVGADTYEVVKKAIEYNRLTQGAFDITVWPLIALWKKGEKENIFPSHDEILRTKKMLGPSQIELLSNNQIRLLNEAVKIDLGGIAAGYGVDEAVRIFHEHGLKDFLIDAGGDLFAGGHNCQGQPWRIGIRDPRDAAKLLEVIYLTDSAVTTSGDYEKFYEINGQRWSHIFNPITGYPQKGVKSATVIAPTTLEADVLATALCVLGGWRDQALIDALGPGYAALIIESSDGRQLKTFESRHYRNYGSTRFARLPLNHSIGPP